MLQKFCGFLNNMLTGFSLDAQGIEETLTASRSRPRSRSVSPQFSIWEDSVESSRMMEHDTGRNPDLQKMIASYDNYEIKSAQAQCYIESLTPDLIVSKTTKVDVGKYFGTAVLVVEVAGFRNWATKRILSCQWSRICYRL